MFDFFFANFLQVSDKEKQNILIVNDFVLLF